MSELSISQAKEQAKERDGYACRFCGVTREQHKEKYGRDIHAHHIIKEGNGGSDSVANLITVCRSCHNTLENTQAKALDRIRNDHTRELEEQVEALESELEEARDTVEKLRENVIDGPIPVFTWLEDRYVEYNILVEGWMDPDVQTFSTREEAVEAYKDHEGSVKLMTANVCVSDLFEDSLRAVSPVDIELYANANGSNYFDEGREPSGFKSFDIPSELESIDDV